MSTEKRPNLQRPTALDFFSGSGLVSYALAPEFKVIWANDNCPKKAAVYRANHDHDGFVEADVAAISGSAIPRADLAWASFPWARRWRLGAARRSAPPPAPRSAPAAYRPPPALGPHLSRGSISP